MTILKVHRTALRSPARPHFQMVTQPPKSLLAEVECLNVEPVKHVRYLDLHSKFKTNVTLKEKYEMYRKKDFSFYHKSIFLTNIFLCWNSFGIYKK